jgi:Prokaryotic membrane lipoprotein lipid attachment site
MYVKSQKQNHSLLNKNISMKKIFFVFVLAALLSSCAKDKCWIYTDCAGNDIGTSCGSENDAKDYCAANGTASCPVTYRKQ